MRTKIYILKDYAGQIRYVGKTIKSLRERLTQHIYTSKTNKHHAANWIRSMIANSVLPTIHLVEEVYGDGCKQERMWISEMRKNGHSLVNSTDGGEGVAGLRHTLEMRKEWSRTRKGKQIGRVVTNETKARISEALKGHAVSESCRKKLTSANTGKKPSQETRVKIRNTLKGRVFSLEWRLKISKAKLGYHHTPEALKKMRDAKVGRHLTPEHKKNIGIAMGKRILSSSHKARISASLKKRSITQSSYDPRADPKTVAEFQ